MVSSKHTEGLKFRQMDLHVHTPASKDFIDKTITAQQIVQASIDANLEMIAVTDHNSSEWIDKVVEASKGTSLKVFPGVELTCTGGQGGIHVIALFEIGSGKAIVDHLLSKLDVLPEKRGDLKHVIDKTVREVIKEIRAANGLAILAHANSGSGALNEIRGQERIAIVKDKNLNAVEATDSLDQIKKANGTRLLDHLDGSNQSYDNRVLAVYQASDNPDASGDERQGHGIEGIAKRSSYFKMDTVCLEALRQCFSDPKVRIKNVLENMIYPHIDSISIEGGYFDKKSSMLHSGLNSILGGKGAGKSLLVELLRFGLNQPSSVDSVKKDHDTKLAKRLDNYGRVTIDLVDADGKRRSVVRSYIPSEDNPFENDEMRGLADNFPVLFLSQNEIISIAEDEKAQLAFIDKFFNFKHHKLIISDLENQLTEWDVRLADSIRASKEIIEVRALTVSTRKELKDLDAKLENPIFAELKIEESKKLYLESRDAEVIELKQLIELAVKSDGFDVFDQSDLEEKVSSDPLVKRLTDIETTVKQAAKDRLVGAIQLLKNAETEIQAEREKFLPAYTTAKAKYDEQVRQGGGDDKALAAKRTQKAKELDGLLARSKRLDTKSKDIKKIAADRKDLLTTLKKAYSTYATERKTKLKTIEASSSERLRLDISEGNNRDAFTEKLKELKKGSYLKDYEIQKITENIDPFDFINNVLYYVISGDAKYVDQIAEQVELDPERLKQLIDFLVNNYEYEFLLEMQYKVMPEDRPDIEYNISNEPSRPLYRPLAELSTGQKCTAMLIIALSDGNQPIVIDQPEDSLDIKSVWQDMCARLRVDKIKRQFVFTTHNSSLAVASDTDRYLIIEGGANSGNFLSSGSMDEPAMNSEVIKYLEGDLDAYHLKAEKYNLKW